MTDSSCALPDPSQPSITVSELRDRLRSDNPPVLIDVRQPEEHAESSIPGSRLIPLGELAGRLDEIPRDGEILVHCKSGGRSSKAVAFLRENGFDGATNVSGGITAWQKPAD